MADGENFEDDLFADLYTEEDTSSKPVAAPTVVEKAEPPHENEAKAEVAIEQDEQAGNGDEQMYTGDQDLDDEIDFNLGNGNSYDTPPANEAHGPGIKEDG